ncbi:MAG: enoyl-CoA hydratase/isomerase family protein, partial [Dongiaceae bacterium]
EFHSKMNAIGEDTVRMAYRALERTPADFDALVIGNQGEHFCAGANLMLMLLEAQEENWEELDMMARVFQNSTMSLRYSPKPVVVAPFQMTFGGGCEMVLHADRARAAAETYIGLVEVGVGIIPAGGGTKEMLVRAMDSIPKNVTDADEFPFVKRAFETIALAKVATSAEEGKAFGYFRHTDGVSFDRARQLHEAKQRVLGLAGGGWHPPVPRAYKLPGESGIATLSMMVDTLVAGGYASEHDAKIARKLAAVLCGGVSGATHAVTEDEVLELEREAFVSLCGEPKSQERMQYMLMNNKPLRN